MFRRMSVVVRSAKQALGRRGDALRVLRAAPPRSTAEAPDAEESIEHLVDLLDELGFAPARRGDEQVGLRHCPFLELVESQKAVICPIHLGVMQGALESWEAPVTVDRLEAFVEPDLCLAQLSRRVAAT